MSEDRPIGGDSEYKMNWDEIDENTNPFGLGAAFGGSKIVSSPVRTALPKSNDEGKESEKPSPPNKNKHQSGDGDQDRALTKTEASKSKKNMKGPPPPPPTRTVSNPGSPEHSVHKDNRIPDVANVAPPDEVLPQDGQDVEEAPLAGSRVGFRRDSNTSTGTFDLATTSGNRSPTAGAAPFPPEVELPMPVGRGGAPPVSVDEELASLRADKEHLTTIIADMQRCIAEYERSLRQLAEEKANAEASAKESVVGYIAERDQAIEEVATIEKAFGDLHRRFEKSKQIIEGFKKNEELLKKTAQEYQDQLRRQDQKYQSLKTHAEQQLTKVAEETERAKRANDDELTRLRAAIKRSELRIHSLESQLEQKVRENTELTKICDELLNKYGDK